MCLFENKTFLLNKNKCDLLVFFSDEIIGMYHYWCVP